MLTGIVYKSSQFWSGHPDVAFFNNQLFVVFRQSDNHRPSGLTRLMLTSSTNGHLYEPPVCISESLDRYNCPRLSVIDNKLWVICDIVKNTGDFIASENTPSNTRIVLFHSDNGTKWTGPIITNIFGIVPDKICKLSDDYGIACHTHFKNDLNDRLACYFWKTKDLLSNSWFKYEIANKQDCNLCEPSISYNGNELVCLIRENSQRGDPAYWTCSNDNGKSWMPAIKTRMFGCHRPVLGRLKSGHYLTTYRDQSHIHTPSCWARNTFACFTFVQSMHNKEYPCYKSIIFPLDHDNAKVPDSGYTGWVQMDNGLIYVVNYITKSGNKPYISWYSFEEKEIVTL